MKTRLGIVALGVLLGVLGKWGLSERGDQNLDSQVRRPNLASASLETSTAQRLESGAAEGNADQLLFDTLVPPAPLVGVGATKPTSFVEISADERALFEPHGEQVCASGCAVSRHPTKELTEQAFGELLKQFAAEPISEQSPALETLLFFGRQARALLEKYGAGSLDPQREAVLRKELLQTHAKVSIRVVDETGVVRSSLPPTRVPLDRRHVFSMDVNNVQPLVTSGTVKRVGLYHLWTRL